MRFAFPPYRYWWEKYAETSGQALSPALTGQPRAADPTQEKAGGETLPLHNIDIASLQETAWRLGEFNKINDYAFSSEKVMAAELTQA
jgi:hypothetical protein